MHGGVEYAPVDAERGADERSDHSDDPFLPTRHTHDGERGATRTQLLRKPVVHVCVMLLAIAVLLWIAAAVCPHPWAKPREACSSPPRLPLSPALWMQSAAAQNGARWAARGGIRAADMQRALEVSDDFAHPGALRMHIAAIGGREVRPLWPSTGEEATHSPDRRVQIMYAALREISANAPVPNVTIMWSAGDGCKWDGPVLADSSTIEQQQDSAEPPLLFPDPEALEGHDDRLQQVRAFRGTIPWEDKRDLAIWRGSSTGGTPEGILAYDRENYRMHLRSLLVLSSLQHPDDVDARFTLPIVQTGDAETEALMIQAGMTTERHMSWQEQLQYKYVILVDGNVCSWSRAVWQLASDSLMLKVDSSFHQWWYHRVQPYVHYVPVKADMSDLAQQVAWARAHQPEVRAIIRRANQFAEQHFTRQAVLQYAYAVILQVAELEQQSGMKSGRTKWDGQQA